MDHKVGIAGQSLRQRERHAQPGDPGPAVVDIRQRDLGTGEPRQQPGGKAADDARPDDVDALARPGAGVPHGIECGLMLAASTARPGGRASGSGATAVSGTT